MSRSRRKTPIVGHDLRQRARGQEALTSALAHRERTALTSASPEALSAHLPPAGKPGQQRLVDGQDGRSYWPVKRQAATADRIANHKGRKPARTRLPEKSACCASG